MKEVPEYRGNRRAQAGFRERDRQWCTHVQGRVRTAADFAARL